MSPEVPSPVQESKVVRKLVPNKCESSLRRLNSVALTLLELSVERTWRSLKKWARESLRYSTWRSVGDSGNNNHRSNKTGKPPDYCPPLPCQ